MATATSSDQFSLNWRDLARGFIVAAIGAAITTIYQALQTGGIGAIDWATIGGVALASGLAYLIKNFVDQPKIVIVDPSKEEIKAVKNGNAEAEVKVVPK